MPSHGRGTQPTHGCIWYPPNLRRHLTLTDVAALRLVCRELAAAVERDVECIEVRRYLSTE